MMSLMAWGESFDRLLECKSKATYSSHCPVKGCSLSIPHPLSLSFFFSTFSILHRSALQILVNCPRDFFRRIEDIFSSQVHQTHLEDIFKEDDTGRDKKRNLSCRCRQDDFNQLLFIYKAGTRSRLSPDHTPALFLKMTEVADKFFLFLTLYAAFRLSSLH